MDFYSKVVSTAQEQAPDLDLSSLTYLKKGYSHDSVIMELVNSHEKLLHEMAISNQKTIKIPDNLRKICQQGIIFNLARINDTLEIDTSNTEDLAKFQTAQLALTNLKNDIWTMCLNIWKAVWLDKINEDISYVSIPDDIFDTQSIYYYNISDFRVTYQLMNNICLVTFIRFDWEKNNLRIGAGIFTDNSSIQALINTETANIEKRYYDEPTTNDNQSKFSISLTQNTEITDTQLEELKKAAEEISNYLNTNKWELTNKER